MLSVQAWVKASVFDDLAQNHYNDVFKQKTNKSFHAARKEVNRRKFASTYAMQ